VRIISINPILPRGRSTLQSFETGRRYAMAGSRAPMLQRTTAALCERPDW
jgi:hypothetical protein